MYENGLYIFRRDLRIVDNVGLYLLQQQCKHIYTIFIYTPEQIQEKKNIYYSAKSVDFMNQCILDLQKEIKKYHGELYLLYGTNNEIISNLISLLNIDIVAFNRDYTPYARKRDDEIIELCSKSQVKVIQGLDYYLLDPETIPFYKKFTPFYHFVRTIPIQKPLPISTFSFKQYPMTSVIINTLQPLMLNGGRLEAWKHINSFHDYITDDLNKSTSLLSPYIKYGCISIRELYHLFKHKINWIRQLYWREFYALVLYHTQSYQAMYPSKSLRWNYNQLWFSKWCNGETGFPIIDASMRHLNHSGYMHNRSRLIVSNFLVKILLISWKYGELYFANKLIDYDPASNNGNWQWTAGVGVDSQPYFRILNPWIQSKKFDPECTFIKHWIPELKEIPTKHIHQWYEFYKNYNIYIIPICDFFIQKDKYFNKINK